MKNKNSATEPTVFVPIAELEVVTTLVYLAVNASTVSQPSLINVLWMPDKKRSIRSFRLLDESMLLLPLDLSIHAKKPIITEATALDRRVIFYSKYLKNE